MARQKKKDDKTENPKVSSSQDGNDEVTNDEPEVWDVVKVINPKDCEKPACRLNRCKQTAVAVWAANSSPDDTWPVCEKCQLAEFGGWPEGAETPEDDDTEQIGLGTEHEKQNARKKRAKCSLSPENSADNKGSGSKNKGATTNKIDEEKDWRLVEILSKNAVAGRSHSNCMTENCKVRAACVYVSSKAPKEKWYTCLDCQVREQSAIKNRLVCILINFYSRNSGN